MVPRDLLDALRGYLGSGAPITEEMQNAVSGGPKIYRIHCFQVHSQKLARDLARQGVIARREKSGGLPDAVRLYPLEFLAGAWDGDGWLQRINRSKGRPRFFLSSWQYGLCGSYALLSLFAEHARRAGISTRIDRNGRSPFNYKLEVDGPGALELVRIFRHPGLPRLKSKEVLCNTLDDFRKRAEDFGLVTRQRGDGLRFENTERAQLELAGKFEHSLRTAGVHVAKYGW